MSEIKILRILEKVENLLCVYRNYYLIKKYHKLLVSIRIIVGSCFNFAIFIYNCHFINALLYSAGDVANLYILNHFLNYVTVITCVICAILNTMSYKDLITNLNTIHNVYITEICYTKSLKRLRLFLVTCTVIYYIIKISVSIVRLLIHLFLSGISQVPQFIVLVISELCYETLFLLEHVVVYSYITIIYNLLKCINLSVSKVLLHIDDDLYESALTVAEVNQWTERYQYLMNCVKLLSACFQKQVSIYFL